MRTVRKRPANCPLLLVTLNPSTGSGQACFRGHFAIKSWRSIERWMLKQVQHDDVGEYCLPTPIRPFRLGLRWPKIVRPFAMTLRSLGSVISSALACAGRSGRLRPRMWMVFAWAAILLVLIGIAVLAGGPHCEVPKSGPLHWLLEGRKFVPTHSRYSACREVK